MTIFGHLKAGHSRQRHLAASILAMPAGGRNGARLFDLLCDEAEAQAAAEEHTFYAAVLTLSGDQEMSRRAVRRHDDTAVLIGEISALTPDSDEWREGIDRFARLIDRHIEEVEEVLTLARPLIAQAQAVQLGERYLKAKANWIGAFGRVPAPCPVPAAASDPMTLSRCVAAKLPGRSRRWFQKFGRPLLNWPRSAAEARSNLWGRQEPADYGSSLGRSVPTRSR
ncbi:MAG: hemerythrin domain-containing protein [Kiloniellaceae bacterium]